MLKNPNFSNREKVITGPLAFCRKASLFKKRICIIFAECIKYRIYFLTGHLKIQRQMMKKQFLEGGYIDETTRKEDCHFS